MNRLFPQQVDGVRFLERRRGRALLALDTGLGKTGTLLRWLRHRRHVRPVVIICPTSVRLHWQAEIAAWLGESAFLPQGIKGIGDGYAGEPFIVIHYAILAAWRDWLKRLGPRCVGIDECQMIRSSSAAWTKATKALCAGVPHVVGLTGTPIVNRPIEAFNILKLIDPSCIPNYHEYTRRWCNAKYNGFGWDVSGASHTEELHARLINTVMLRRKKSDCMEGMPPKVRSFVPLEIDNRRDYDAAQRDFIAYLRRTEGNPTADRARRAEQITKINKLRSLAAAGKIAAALSWVEDMLDSGGNKLVLFAVHHAVMDAVCARFNDMVVRLDGNTPTAKRGTVIERFQTDPRCRLFMGQIQAAGTGVDGLQKVASHAALLELPWTPGDVIQAEGRLHRIGQDEMVNIYYLVGIRTIDETMGRLLDRKRAVLDSLLDGAPDASPSILADLLDEYRRGPKLLAA